MPGKIVNTEIMESDIVKRDSEKQTNNDNNSMDLLEDALNMCQFGKFHIRLTLVTFAAISSEVLVNTTTAFVLPIAECDLKMNNVQKGLLTIMPFFGLITTALFINFLTDTFGRKSFIIYGMFGLFLARIVQGLSQNYLTLVIGKYVEGFFSSFCFPATLVMLTEMFPKKLRQKALLLNSTFMPIHVILVSLIAWAILPQKWDFVIIEGIFEIYSWSIFFYACSLFGLIGGLWFCVIPESPKYLFTHGQEDKALEILKHIYSENTGKDKNTFPVITLKSKENCNVQDGISSFKKKLVQGMFDIKFLFKKPHLGRLMYYSLLVFITLFVSNSLKAWFPQISAIAENYEKRHNKIDNFCTMITEYTDSFGRNEISQNTSNLINGTDVCKPHISDSETYIGSIILGCIALFGIAISTTLVDLVGAKPLMCLLYLVPASLVATLYWTRSAIQIAVIQATVSGIMTTCFSLQMSLIVPAFPTTVRALAVSIILFSGRVSSIIGGIVFPIMLNTGCMVPYIVLSAMMLCIACLAYFMPNPGNPEKGDQ